MDAPDAELLTALEELRQEVRLLRDRLDGHVADGLRATHVLASQQRRQSLIGRATIALGRYILDDGDDEEQVLRGIIDRMENELGLAGELVVEDEQ